MTTTAPPQMPAELGERGPVALGRILDLIEEFEELAAEIAALVALSEEAAGDEPSKMDETFSVAIDWNEQTGIGAAFSLLVVLADKASEAASGSGSSIYTPLSSAERRAMFGHLLAPADS